MMGKHTPEPWTINHGANIFAVRTDTGIEVCLASTGGHQSNTVDTRPENVANAERVVACVNALAGIADPAAFVAEAKRLRTACEWRCVSCGCTFPDHPAAIMSGERRKLELDGVTQCTPCLVRASQAAMIATLLRQRDELRKALANYSADQ